MELLSFENYYLIEERKDNLTYKTTKVKNELDKVTTTIAAKESEKFTKLAKKYKSLKESAEQLEQQRKEFNELLTGEVLDYFDSEDEVLTRVLETVSMTLLLSKKSTRTTKKVNVDKIIEGLIDLVPELETKVIELVETNTKITTTNVKPSLKVSLKENYLFNSIKSFVNSLKLSIEKWKPKFDFKLKQLKNQISNL